MKRYLKVDGFYVPLEQPAPVPRYDAWHIMAAAAGGFFFAILSLATLVINKL